MAFENDNAASMPEYYVEDIGGGAALLDLEGNSVKFEEAYIIYEGERIDVTDCVFSYEELFGISFRNVAIKLEENNKIEEHHDIARTTQTFEIVKDGKSYFGEAYMTWLE